MQWILFWTIIAQVFIVGVLGIIFSLLVKLWTFWWVIPKEPVQKDFNILIGPTDD